MREKYITRNLVIGNEMVRETAIQILRNLPLDPIRPLEVVFREQQKQRKMTQNDLMWAHPLKEIAEQAWVQNRLYSDEVWHQHFKQEYLPEEYDQELTKEGYRKWDTDPKGKKILVGSTKDLTVKGFSIYLEQIYADGANMGVRFSADIR